MLSVIKGKFTKKYPEIKKVKLDILGISYNKSGDQIIYVVILGEDGGTRKIPVMINYFEAQAIAIEVEKISPIVPFVYDAFKEIIISHKINFEEILITEFKNDVLLTYLVGKKDKVELRTSDALSLSVRMGYPIYIYEPILEKVDKEVQKFYTIKDSKEIIPYKDKLASMTIEELNDSLSLTIEDEEYEKASEIRDELLRRKMQSQERQ
jgi:hypothetical protein